MEMDPLTSVVQKKLENGLASLCQTTVSKVLNYELFLMTLFSLQLGPLSIHRQMI